MSFNNSSESSAEAPSPQLGSKVGNFIYDIWVYYSRFAVKSVTSVKTEVLHP